MVNNSIQQNSICDVKKTVYKMRLRWKLILGISLLINIIFVVAVVSFTTIGKKRITVWLSGDIYPLYILSHKGHKAWRLYNNVHKNDMRSDIKHRRRAYSTIRKTLRQGSVDAGTFRLMFMTLEKMHDEKYQRFIMKFPKFWNTLTDKQRKQYLKHRRKKYK